MTTLTASNPAATRESTACTHCGLDVPHGLIEEGTPHQFCCNGCRSVYAIIHGRGLDRYYALRRQLEKSKSPAPDTRANLAAFDDQAFIDTYTTRQPDGTASATLALEGMHCAACVWLVEKLDRVTPGVLSSTADYRRATATVRWDPASATFGSVALGLAALGYIPSPPRAASASIAHQRDARRQLVRIGVAGAIAGNIMLVTIALYAGLFEGIEQQFRDVFRWVSAGLGLLSLAWPGRVFFRGAVASLRTRVPHLDLPISIALLAGGIWGTVNTVRGTGEIYFDSIATLVFFLLVGRFIQSQQQRRAADAVEMMLSIAPSTARIREVDGSIAIKSSESVKPGDTAVVHAGDTIPADGEITSGSTAIDQALLTGESRPVRATVGDTVWAGSINLTSELCLRVSHAGAETRAARLMRLVADATANKAPIVQLADRIAGRFTVVVIALAALTTLGWWRVSPDLAIEHATALLIVTCPCALGLATPLVISAAIGRLARRGILVKGGDTLERLAKPADLMLDKTGTLTIGSPTPIEWLADTDTIARAAALESKSTHPIARAITAARTATVAHDVIDIEQLNGLGIRGTVDGIAMTIGSATLFDHDSIEIPPHATQWAAHHAVAGRTPIFIASNGAWAGGVAIGDALRPEAPRVLDRLSQAGWTHTILSGDHHDVVASIAASLGIDDLHQHAAALPEDKLTRIREAVASSDRTVVMIGDGINDAAALAAADVGIAMQGGSDAALDAADVLIQRGGLLGLDRLEQAARNTMTRIRLCLALSLGYNAVAASLAITGFIHPLLAAVLMPISSVTVVVIAASAPRAGRAEGGQ